MSRGWSPDQLETLRINFADWPTYLVAHVCDHSYTSTAQMAKKMGLSKSEAFLRSPASGRTDGTRGSACRFQKGQQSWNKGRPQSEWMPVESRARIKATQFKPGELQGAARHNYVPIGSLRITRDGMLERKVTDDPKLYPARRWVAVSRLVWEAANGPIPAGHAVVFRPGCASTDEARITLDALELVTRAELMRRNSRHTRYPPEVNQLIQLKGALNRKINRRVKEREEQA